MLWRLIRRLILVAILFIAAVWALSIYHANRPPPPLVTIEGQVDRIKIEKSTRRMRLYQDELVVREYTIALGFAPSGDKSIEGDGKTPEGVFKIDRRNPNSKFHLSLGIDYPRAEDCAQAETLGQSPGGDIFIHGQPNRLAGLGTLPYDWTAGCISVSDGEIEEIWRVTPIGTVVEILP
jgi:murein L,D-transpeptidase YafK